MAPSTTVCWHRPLGAPDTVRRLTIGRPCWSTSSIEPSSLHVLEVDCPPLVGFEMLEKFVSTTNHGSTLKRLRIINGCNETVARYLFDHFAWTAIELEDHSAKLLEHLPISVTELRLMGGLSMDAWLALVQRGKEGLLLQNLYLVLDMLEPAVRSKLVDQVIRDDSFVVYGISGDIQWYSTLNLWSQGSAKALGRDDLSKAVRIVKDWKRRFEVEQSVLPKVPSSDRMASNDSSPIRMKHKLYVCPGQR